MYKDVHRLTASFQKAYESVFAKNAQPQLFGGNCLKCGLHHRGKRVLALFRRSFFMGNHIVRDSQQRKRLPFILRGKGIQLGGLHLDRQKTVSRPQLPRFKLVIKHIR